MTEEEDDNDEAAPRSPTSFTSGLNFFLLGGPRPIAADDDDDDEPVVPPPPQRRLAVRIMTSFLSSEGILRHPLREWANSFSTVLSIIAEQYRHFALKRLVVGSFAALLRK